MTLLMETLNAEAQELQERIAANVARRLNTSSQQTMIGMLGENSRTLHNG